MCVSLPWPQITVFLVKYTFIVLQNAEDKLNEEMQLFENFFAKQPHETIK